MSQSSLLLAVKQFIIDNVTFGGEPLSESLCNVMPGPKPPSSMSGELFISVYPGGFRGKSFEVLEVTHSINIAISLKLGRVPQDHWGTELIANASTGIEDLGQILMQLIHNNVSLINYADTLVDDNLNKWTEPLRFNTGSPPRIVTGEWFHSEDVKTEEGIVLTLAFGDALRTQWADYQGAINTYGQNAINYIIDEGIPAEFPPEVDIQDGTP